MNVSNPEQILSDDDSLFFDMVNKRAEDRREAEWQEAARTQREDEEMCKAEWQKKEAERRRKIVRGVGAVALTAFILLGAKFLVGQNEAEAEESMAEDDSPRAESVMDPIAYAPDEVVGDYGVDYGGNVAEVEESSEDEGEVVDYSDIVGEISPEARKFALKVEGILANEMTEEDMENMEKTYELLRERNEEYMDEVHIAAIMGNIMQENRFGPQETGITVGICQWEGPRKIELMKKLEPFSLQTQIDFIFEEFETTERPARRAFEEETNVAGAAEAFCSRFERAGMPQMERRIGYALVFCAQSLGISVEELLGE